MTSDSCWLTSSIQCISHVWVSYLIPTHVVCLYVEFWHLNVWFEEIEWMYDFLTLCVRFEEIGWSYEYFTLVCIDLKKLNYHMNIMLLYVWFEEIEWSYDRVCVHWWGCP